MRKPDCFAATDDPQAKPLKITTRSDLEESVAGLDGAARAFVLASGFKGEPGRVLPLPGAGGGVAAFLAGRADPKDGPWAGALPSALPEGVYRLEGLSQAETERAALFWGLGAYQYTNYKAPKRAAARLAVSSERLTPRIEALLEAAYLVRDLVNTPAIDMGPDQLEAAARSLAARHDARIGVIAGEQLKREGLDLIHAVGMAATRPPRLIDLTWGSPSDPKVTLVGKGVCFDTGGLDIKPSSGMAIMKKDMGGAAHVLGLAHIVMSLGLKMRLRVLIPAVENAIAGNAMRPGDVFRSRKGLTVEITNTDAEGRLILADALSLADGEAPDLVIDMATLTGAARVALGPELPAVFTDDEDFAAALAKASAAEHDPHWRLPLWQPYAKWLESSIADLNNSPSGTFAGSIVAALFLKRFVERAKSWTHVDVYAWNTDNGPAKAIGGEAQLLRALSNLLIERYG